MKKILTTVKDHKVIVDSQLKTLQDNEALDSLGEAIENVDHKLNVVNRQMNAKSSFFKSSVNVVNAEGSISRKRSIMAQN